MPAIEMFVSLKVPDNVAITAFNALKRMGFKELKGLERSDYYKFEINDDVAGFKEKISNVDILVNANKHKHSFELNNNKDINKKSKNKDNNFKEINILIQDIDDGTGLLSTLKERLGFDNIKKLEKGVLWTMHFDKKTNAKKVSMDITKNLLMNENFQRFRLIK